MKRRFITQEERNKISLLLTEGHSMSSIARLMGRNTSSIRREVSHNGGRNSYDPEGFRRKGFLHAVGLSSKALYDRVDTLEEHIKILYELIERNNDL